jgi:hypothetical protein
MRRVDFIDLKRNELVLSLFQIGESGRSNVELEKVIALMKKRIDHLQADNQTLKSDLDRQRATVNRRIFYLIIFKP